MMLFKLKSCDATPKYDVFWMVYDLEVKHKYSDEFHQIAFKKDKDNAIHIALSSFCFEIWGLRINGTENQDKH